MAAELEEWLTTTEWLLVANSAVTSIRDGCRRLRRTCTNCSVVAAIVGRVGGAAGTRGGVAAELEDVLTTTEWLPEANSAVTSNRDGCLRPGRTRANCSAVTSVDGRLPGGHTKVSVYARHRAKKSSYQPRGSPGAGASTRTDHRL